MTEEQTPLKVTVHPIHPRRPNNQTMLKLTLIATLTLLPILAILATILLDELGCHGGTANMGQDEVFCMIKGINFGAVYETVGSIAFFAIIAAPLSLLWVIGGIIVFVRTKLQLNNDIKVSKDHNPSRPPPTAPSAWRQLNDDLRSRRSTSRVSLKARTALLAVAFAVVLPLVLYFYVMPTGFIAFLYLLGCFNAYQLNEERKWFLQEEMPVSASEIIPPQLTYRDLNYLAGFALWSFAIAWTINQPDETAWRAVMSALTIVWVFSGLVLALYFSRFKLLAGLQSKLLWIATVVAFIMVNEGSKTSMNGYLILGAVIALIHLALGLRHLRIAK